MLFRHTSSPSAPSPVSRSCAYGGRWWWWQWWAWGSAALRPPRPRWSSACSPWFGTVAQSLESGDSAYQHFFLICFSGLSQCGTLTALSSTCHANLHLDARLPHIILRQALVGASVRHAEGSSKIQRPIGVGDDPLWQLTAVSENRTKKEPLQIHVVLLFWCFGSQLEGH